MGRAEPLRENEISEYNLGVEHRQSVRTCPEEETVNPVGDSGRVEPRMEGRERSFTQKGKKNHVDGTNPVTGKSFNSPEKG